MKTRNRILSIILALMLCIGILPLTAFAATPVDYTLVLYEGKGYENISSGTVVTLSELGITSSVDELNGYTYYTFNGVNFETTAATAIAISDENAIIKLADNSVNVVKGGDNGMFANGIYTEGNLTITGNGKLDITAGDATEESYGISVDNNFIMESGTVRATGGEAPDYSKGIYVYDGDFVMNGGYFTGIGGTSEDESYGIEVWGDITVNDGTVTAVGGEAENDSYGIYGDDNFTIAGGTVTASGGKATGNYSYSYGICIYENFTANGGTVTAKGNTAGRTSCGIYTTIGDITVTGGTVSATGGEAIGFKSLGICAAAEDIGSEGNFKVTGGTVNGTGGKAAEVSIGISAFDDFTVENGNVTAISDEARDKSYGIEADGDFTVSGGKVKGIGGEAKLDGFGLCAGSDANITAGEVILSGSSVASGGVNSQAESAISVAPNTQVGGVNVMSVYGGEIADGTNASYIAAWVGAGSDDVSSYKYLRFTNTYSVTVINGIGSGEYEKGATVTIKANQPESGMLFDKWVGADGLTFTSGSAATADAEFTMPAAAVTLTATYVESSVSPPTGDNSNTALWLALLSISSIGIVGTTLYGRKKRITN